MWECFNMGTELPTKVMLGQKLVLMQITFWNNIIKLGRLVLSRTSCSVKEPTKLQGAKSFLWGWQSFNYSRNSVFQELGNSSACSNDPILSQQRYRHQYGTRMFYISWTLKLWEVDRIILVFELNSKRHFQNYSSPNFIMQISLLEK
jgi:hypothetical protein